MTHDTIILGWRFWPKNAKYLTLLCDSERLRSYPEMVYGITHPTANEIIDPPRGEVGRRNLFLKLTRITAKTEDAPALIKKVTFCNEGLDIEFFNPQSGDTRYDIMRRVEGLVGELFPNKKLEFKGVVE